MCGIAVGPLYGLGSAVVGADVAHEISREIFNGGEDSSGDNLPLDLGEPDLDLVEPGRIGRSVMELHVGMV